MKKTDEILKNYDEKVAAFADETRPQLTQDLILALRECEFALKDVIKTGKVGWLQDEAHKTAIVTLKKI